MFKLILLTSLFLGGGTFASPFLAGPAEQEVRITRLQLASHIGSDLGPMVPTSVFKAADTIYLAVTTVAPEVGSPGHLSVAWRYGGGQDELAVHDEGKELVFRGQGITVFQIAKPDGWPRGDYYVAVYIDGLPVKRLDFKVK